MKYEHQINWAIAYNNNLDISTVRSASEPFVVPYFISFLPLSERMANLEVCTSYDHKNWTNSYDFLRIIRVDALLLSVSFKPTFVDFTIVLHMLVLLQFSLPLSCDKFFIYFAQFKHSEFFQSVCQTCWIFSECLPNTLNFFRVFGLKKFPLFIFRPLLL